MLEMVGSAHSASRHTPNGKEKLEMKNILSQLWKEEDGQDLTEYALLVVLVALGSVAAMGSLSQAISKSFSSAAANLTT
jgi:pilus assembly protein Flp/PilA